MSLKKLVITTYTPGSPGVPADPGEPAHPAGQFERTVSVLTFVTDFFTFISFPYNPLSGSPAGSIAIPHGHFEVRTETVIVTLPASAGRAPTPGVPPTAAQWNIDKQIGFNAGAHSVKRLPADCQVSFKIIQAAGIFVGFTNEDPKQGYKRMSHALYFRDSVVQIREFGVQQGPSSSFTSATTFIISRVNGRVTYLRNGVRLYTSLTNSLGSVVVDADLYAGGDTIE